DPKEGREFLAKLRASGESDMLLGAIVLTDELPAHLDEYERLAAARGDAWFATIAARARAQADLAKGDFARAERRLRDEIVACDAHRLDYRCAFLQFDLAELL